MPALSDNAKFWVTKNEYLRWLDITTEDRGKSTGPNHMVHCRLLETNLFAMRREEVRELKKWIRNVGESLELEGSNLPFNDPTGKEPMS